MEKKKKTRLIIFLAVLVVLAIIVIGNLSKSSGNKVTVQTDTVQKGKITASVSGSAKIQPEVQVKISAKVSGQITDLGVKEGDFVKKGDFLVQLDQEYYKAALDQAESNYRYAVAGYDKAKNDWNRSQRLFEDNLVSESELDIAESTYKQAKAQVDQNKAMRDQARDNLSKTTIFSPMDGTVSQLNKKVGEMAMGSQFTLDVIMVVADLNKMLAETEIDENDVVSVSVGDTSDIEVDAFPDSVFKGVVTEIANTGETKGLGTQEEVTNFLVKVAMLAPPERIRPGMSATVDVLTDTRKDALKVPIQCVTVRKPLPPKEEGEPEKEKGKKSRKKQKQAEDDTTATEEPQEVEKESVQKEEEPIRVVFVVKEEIAKQVPVKTGISSDTEWEIIEGVAEDDEVVSGSYRILSKQLKDGDEVKIDNSLKKYGRDEE
jgi:HlyD family secretion protein